MVAKRLALALALALASLPLVAESAASNPLEGHDVALQLPALSLAVDGDLATAVWSGPAYVLVDSRAAARIVLPVATAPLPRRRWTLRDYLVAVAIALGAGILGAGAGALAVALH